MIGGERASFLMFRGVPQGNIAVSVLIHSSAFLR